MQRDVLGDVGDQGAVVDDDVVGHEVVVDRNGEVERLLLADRLDRGDLVPPEVGGREVVEGGIAGGLGEPAELRARHASRADVPVVVTPVAAGLADVGPRAAALGGGDLRPHLGRDRVDVGARHPTAEVGQRGLGLRLLAHHGDQLAECADALLAGDPHLEGVLAGAVVDRPPQLADRRDDPEPQQEVLDVTGEPVADRGVADLAEPLSGVDVAVARVQDRQEPRHGGLVQAEDGVGDELLRAALAHQPVLAAQPRDGVGRAALRRRQPDLHVGPAAVDAGARADRLGGREDLRQQR